MSLNHLTDAQVRTLAISLGINPADKTRNELVKLIVGDKRVVIPPPQWVSYRATPPNRINELITKPHVIQSSVIPVLPKPSEPTPAPKPTPAPTKETTPTANKTDYKKLIGGGATIAGISAVGAAAYKSLPYIEALRRQRSNFGIQAVLDGEGPADADPINISLDPFHTHPAPGLDSIDQYINRIEAQQTENALYRDIEQEESDLLMFEAELMMGAAASRPPEARTLYENPSRAVKDWVKLTNI